MTQTKTPERLAAEKIVDNLAHLIVNVNWQRQSDVVESIILEATKGYREIVERLPKTADGVPVVPGMRVYSNEIHEMDGRSGEIHVCDFQTCTMAEDHEKMLSDEWTPVGHTAQLLMRCYSTREAALTAKEAQ